MSNEVGYFGGAVKATDEQRLLKAMQETDGVGGRLGDVSYMNFSGKRGVYSIGVNKRAPGEEEPFLVAIVGFELGWMCWKGGKPVSKRMANITQPPIPEPDMTENGPFDTNKGEGWARARAITVRSFENDEQCYFAINSASGVASMSDLQSEVMDRMQAGQACWPVITFSTEEFTSQGFTNFKPVFNVIEWLTNDQVATLADPDVDPMSLLDGDLKGGDEETEEEEQPLPEPKKRTRKRL